MSRIELTIYDDDGDLTRVFSFDAEQEKLRKIMDKLILDFSTQATLMIAHGVAERRRPNHNRKGAVEFYRDDIGEEKAW